MNNIIEYLKAHNIEFNLDNKWEEYLKLSIIENIDIIKEYYSKKDKQEIDNIDGYIDIVFLHKIQNYIKRDKDFGLKINSIIDYSDEFLSLLNKNNLVKNLYEFINKSYEAIYSGNNIFLEGVTFEFIIKYNKEICEKVYKYLIENRACLIYKNFKDLEKKFLKEDELMILLLNKDRIKQNIRYVFQYITYIINKCTSLGKHEDYINAALEEIVLYGESIIKELNESNIEYHYFVIKDITYFLISIKNNNAKTYKKYLQTADDILHNMLENKGKKLPVNLEDEVIDPILTSYKQNNSLYKLFVLTHKKEANNIMVPILDMYSEESVIMNETLKANFDTNEYFTISHQINIYSYLFNCGLVILKIIEDNFLFKELQNLFIDYIKELYKEIDDDSSCILDEIGVLFNNLNKLFHVGNHDKIDELNLLRATSISLCKLVENFLGDIFDSQNKEFIDKKTLGPILDSDIMYKVIGKNQSRRLKYFFCTDKNNSNVGYNLRNKLAHEIAKADELVDKQMVCQILFIFTSILTSSYYYIFSTQDL